MGHSEHLRMTLERTFGRIMGKTVPAAVLAAVLSAGMLLSAGPLTACCAQTTSAPNTAAHTDTDPQAGVQSETHQAPGATPLNMRGTRKTGTARSGPIDVLGTTGRADSPGPDGNTDSKEGLPE